MSANFFAYFYRATPDAKPILFTLIHCILLLIFLAFFITGLLYYRKLSHKYTVDKQAKVIRRIDGVTNAVLLSVIIFLYTWYIYIGQFHDALPIYHCRFATIIFVILFALQRLNVYKKIRALEQWSVTVGSVGTWMAFVVPQPDNFLFPHVTNYTYVIGHLALLSIVFVYLFKWSSRPDFRDWLNMQAFLFVFNIALAIFDRCTGENYGYFTNVPVIESYIGSLAYVWHTLIIVFGYAILLTIFWLFNRAIWQYIHGKQVSA